MFFHSYLRLAISVLKGICLLPSNMVYEMRVMVLVYKIAVSDRITKGLVLGSGFLNLQSVYTMLCFIQAGDIVIPRPKSNFVQRLCEKKEDAYDSKRRAPIGKLSIFSSAKFCIF